ncbi:MAG: Gfo/Idh/MocA family oxidoreductase [Phycisphaerae bacterium]|nr:Gfo/Idh/MocA family oxidoreductase [Phycisphaerae bacterium]
MLEPKRYLICGTGGRALGMFARPLLKDFPDTARLVGLFDPNPARLAAFAELAGASGLPIFTDFERALRETAPDAVVVCSRDCTHAEYLCRSLAAGKRTISEKPVCTTAEQCREILSARDDSGSRGLVTHNVRYDPAYWLIKRLVEEGRIGAIRSMDFRETLDRRHGADYFRRWHRMKANSGGLLIHKASHHFDILNWLAGSRPVWLSAQGSTVFYGKNGPFRSERCLGCRHADRCEFHVDLWTDETNVRLYRDAEGHDGYYRDGCVFDERIDAEDQASVIYRYENGVQVTFSLTAFAVIESHHLRIQGTRGELDYHVSYDTNWAASNITMPGLETFVGQQLRLYIPNEGIRPVEIPSVEGGHGGADPQLRREFFGRSWDAAPTDQMASLDEAVQAVLIGAAASESIATGRPVEDVQDLLRNP